MAFDQYVQITADREILSLGSRHFYTWGEFVLYPVLPAGSTAQGGSAIIRVPYHPVLVQSFSRLGGVTINYWQSFLINGITYAIDTLQIIDGFKKIEITGINGGIA